MKVKPIKEEKKLLPEYPTRIIRIYLILILCALPVVFTNFYFNMLETKYLFYCICTFGVLVLIMRHYYPSLFRIYVIYTACAVPVALGSAYFHYFKKALKAEMFENLMMGIMGIAVLILVVWYFCPSRDHEYKKPVFNRQWFARLSFTDRSLLAFVCISAVSTIASPYPKEAFWGTAGRFSGLFLILLYMVSYFLITRFYRFERRLLDYFLYVSLFVCGFGITDYFKMDLLSFKRNVGVGQRAIYTSTLGNINTYTVYVALAIAIALILFCMETQRRKLRIYYTAMVVGFFAIIMGNSDNAYLAMAALFGFAPFYLFKTRQGLSRYGISVASLFTVIFVIDWINHGFADQVYGIEGVFNVIANLDWLGAIVLLLWALVVALYLLQRSAAGGKLSPKVRIGWGGFVLAVLAAVLFALYDCNVAGNGARYGGLQAYLTFSDSWGTNRGYIWRISVENFQKFTPWQKVFGYGPDTFGIITMLNNYDEMANVYKQRFDSAHNEYIQYLLTVGIAGLGAYLAFFVSAVVGILKKGKENPWVMAVGMAAVCYGAQAVVNISIPIAMPVMLGLLAVGMERTHEQRGI